MRFISKNLLILTACIWAPFFGYCRQEPDTTQHVIAGRKNAKEQQDKPYVILISADGFRHDYPEKFQATNLLSLSATGIRAQSMLPSFPSVTFPNHYTLATGLYPAHHGLVGNSFYDPAKQRNYTMGNKKEVRDSSWYGGTPLWVLAEKQQMLSACLFWVGSEAAIEGIRPTYYYNYSEQIPMSKRVDIVKDWLSLPEEKRPHLITFYLSEPDHAGHRYGPDAVETAKAVHQVDSIVHALNAAVSSTGLPVNFIFLADHGMTAVDREHPLPIPDAIDKNKFIISSSGTMIDLYAKDAPDIKPSFQQLKKQEKGYKVYLKKNVPASLHYNKRDDTFKRIGDIVIIPEWPQVFSARKPGVGYHGFDPLQVKDMHAVFMAWGPAFKSGLTVPSFENVHVYPLIATLLDLKISSKIDGKKRVLLPLLK